MKNTKRTIGWLGCMALLLATACADEEFVREAGTLPGEEMLTGVAAELYRPAVGNRIRLSDGDATDVLRLRLSQPSAQDVSATLAVDADKLDVYNKERGTEYELFPAENVVLEANGTITVPAGETESADFTMTLERKEVEKGEYLLPLTATVGSGEQARKQTVYYLVAVYEVVAESELEKWNFMPFIYVNTEEMNPLIAAQYEVSVIDQFTFDSYTVDWGGVTVLRQSEIRLENGHARFMLGSDLQYVLDNREEYVKPLQQAGHKVHICIQGGGTGLGFRNLTDAQIDEFVFQIETVCTQYELDGINFFDTGAGYDMEGAPEIISSSYAKLLKATKEALGSDKLVTIACDAESTEELSVPQEGISAGEWVDYAYPGIFDEVIDPWADGALLRPLAGIGDNKYGFLTMQTHDTSWNNQHLESMMMVINELYFSKLECSNAFAFWDIPACRAGIEQGGAEAFRYVWYGITDWMMTGNNMAYDGQIKSGSSGYGRFQKDW